VKVPKKALNDLERKVESVLVRLDAIERMLREQRRTVSPTYPVPTESPWAKPRTWYESNWTTLDPDSNVWGGWSVFAVDEQGNIEPVRH
jgi:hypothetical protein